MQELMMSMMAMMMFAQNDAVSGWYMPVKIIFIVLVALSALFLVTIILLQPGNTQGLGEIGGGADSYLGKNKAKTIDGKLKKLTIYVAVVFVVSILALTIIANVTF